ncbi:MAG: response regulator [Chloroflexi bacterium]|nr:response regulator [Chloroflexota bacterium]
MKILIADDESEVRKVIRLILGGQGHDILEAADGERTLEIAGAEMPGLILLDVMMPGKSGIDVLQELKGNRETKSISVIMITALTSAQDENRAMKAGALDYITKPWAPGELEDRIRISVPEFAEDSGSKKGIIKGPAAGQTAVSTPQRASALRAPISTGSDEIDRALLGGIPLGSLTLIEGPSGAGKSVLCEHIAYGAMLADQGVVFYTSGLAPDDLTSRMKTLGLDVKSFISEGQFTIQPLEDLRGGPGDPASPLDILKKHIEGLPWDISVVIIDSLSNLVGQAGSMATLNFLIECKALCRMGNAILITLHTSAFDPEIRNRLDALFATHMTLGTEGFTHGIEMKTMNVIDIAKVKDTNLARKTSIYFEVDTELGRSMNMSIKVLPIHKIKA